MNGLNKTKRAFILLCTYVSLLFAAKEIEINSESITYNEDYEEGSSLPYAHYNGRLIFIGSEEQISSLENKARNIYVIDERCFENPSLSICNSYRIITIHEKENIIKILLNYESEYSSSWDRTLTSMEREWIIHNICYYLNYNSGRTGQVDLDNNDEKTYENIFNVLLNVKKIIDAEIENDNNIAKTLNKFGQKH